jgi:hypothetical protein
MKNITLDQQIENLTKASKKLRENAGLNRGLTPSRNAAIKRMMIGRADAIDIKISELKRKKKLTAEVKLEKVSGNLKLSATMTPSCDTTFVKVDHIFLKNPMFNWEDLNLARFRVDRVRGLQESDFEKIKTLESAFNVNLKLSIELIIFDIIREISNN